MTACGVGADDSGGAFGDTEKPLPANAAAGGAASSCSPNVAGLIPSKIAATKTIQCPSNFIARDTRSAAVPVTGRFTSEQEVIEAFCVATKSAIPRPQEFGEEGSSTSIDFEKNAVVAFAYDASTSAEPKLYQRGDELWLKISEADCRATPQLTSVVFIVPKSSKVNEQTCSRACE